MLLSHRAARLPGLTDHLGGSGISVAVVDPLDMFRGIAAHEQAIRSDPQALRLVTRLPHLSIAREMPARPAPRTRHIAGALTHVVFDGDALAIGSGIALDVAAFKRTAGTVSTRPYPDRQRERFHSAANEGRHASHAERRDGAQRSRHRQRQRSRSWRHRISLRSNPHH
jgi:hypothetical protein